MCTINPYSPILVYKVFQGKEGPIAWSPRSADLIILDFSCEYTWNILYLFVPIARQSDMQVRVKQAKKELVSKR